METVEYEEATGSMNVMEIEMCDATGIVVNVRAIASETLDGAREIAVL